MLKKQTRLLAGAGLLGATAVLLSGCGGGSFSKNTFNNYPNTLPYAYGIEPVAFYGQANAAGQQATIEGSGLQDAANGQAYISGASAFTIVTAQGASLAGLADPNGTNVLPLGFSPGGQYVDAVNQTGAKVATVTSVAPGASVVFRAALANGTSSNNTSPGITGATLTSTDPALAGVAGLTAGLTMTLVQVGGAFSNATYATGTGGTAIPFTLPAETPTGIHTVTVTVSDAAGRVTATQFEFPVVASTEVALFLQNITVLTPAVAATPTIAGAPATPTTTAITPGDLVSLDGGTAVTADAQGTAIFFTTPGTHTITETKPDATAVQTATFTLPLTDAKGVVTGGAPGSTVYDVVDNAVAAAAPPTAAKARRSAALRRH